MARAYHYTRRASSGLRKRLQRSIDIAAPVTTPEPVHLPDSLSAADFDLVCAAREQQAKGFGIAPETLRRLQDRKLLKYV